MKVVSKGRTKGKSGKCLVWLLAICMTNFFGFYIFLPFGKMFYSVDYIHICVSLISLIFLVYRATTRKRIRIRGEFIKIYTALLLLVVIEVMWTYLRYHQPISLTFKEAFYYFVPFLGYYTFLQYKEDIELDEVEDILVKVSIIASVVALIVFFLYTFFGINILQLNDSSRDNFRNGTIRFAIGSMVSNISVVISITRLMQKRIKNLDVLNSFFVFLNIWLVDKSRTALLYIVMMVLIAILMGEKAGKFRKVIVSIGIAGCAVGAFLFFGSLSNEISAYFNADAGIMMRFNTIEFYMTQFREHPILGMGLLSSSKEVAGWQLLYGEAGYFYRDDVGLVGLLNKFGICGLIWIISFLITVIKKEKRTNLQEGETIRNIVIYCAVTMINLSFMDCQRVFYMMDLMILTEMLVMKGKKQFMSVQ